MFASIARSCLSRSVLAVAPVAALVACRAGFAVLPTTSATQAVAAESPVTYAIPRDAPRGLVKVVSYGLVEVSLGDTTANEHLRALHVRMFLRNDGDHSWTVDASAQRLALDGRGVSAPAFASADPGGPPPVITIPTGERRVIDLFFPLPGDLADAHTIPAFDALWRVRTDTGVVVDRTPFQWLMVEPSAFYLGADYGDDYYWGPPYWYNTAYPRFAFAGTDIVPTDYAGHSVVVYRPAPETAFGGTR